MMTVGIVSLLPIIPSPDQNDNLDLREVAISERFSPRGKRGEIGELPQSVLTLMVQFSDLKFADTITNQDFLSNPDYRVRDYVDRFMFHLQSYYLDVSYEAYQINYTVLDTLITLAQPMAYYGNQTFSLERRVQLVQDVIAYIDPLINFTDYDSFVIMHAGAGRETDITGTNPNAISSTFINRRLLQAVLDPENDEYPGIATSDGVYIQEMIISATNHNHPDNPENLNYGNLGTLTHLFGRQMGLPTLFGNVSNLGRAAGAGNFCLMGTGVWNGNGFVPPFLSAWTRIFAGWAEPIIIKNSQDDLEVTYPYNPYETEIPRIYKIPISDDEYYLVENRQQNPDGSTLFGMPSFTFRLLPQGEQDYYPPPYENVPRFNFMKNSYRGCEWDFYLPGLGGPDFPEIDGSGILIWHIDENIIRELYDQNIVNANPNHQGVALMEADGIQHLRSSIPDLYMRGSAYDAYRAGHNDYFGKFQLEDGTISLPFAESYYGKTTIEIHRISNPMNIMTFAVRHPWSLEYEYTGNDLHPVAIIEDKSDDQYLLQTTVSGNIYLYKNYELIPDFPIMTDQIPFLPAYLETKETFLVPFQDSTEGAAYYRISALGAETGLYYPGRYWATHPIVIRDSETSCRYAIALNQEDDSGSMVIVFHEGDSMQNWYSFTHGAIVSNLIHRHNELLFIVRKTADDSYTLTHIDLNNNETGYGVFPLPANVTIDALLMAPMTKETATGREYLDNLIILTSEEVLEEEEMVVKSSLYMFYEDGRLCTGFPIQFPEEILSVPSLADINRNGYLDILLVSSNSLYVIGYNGETLNYPVPTELDYPAITTGKLGVLAFDTTGDGKREIMANLGGNRFVIWDNSFRIKEGYPLMIPTQPRNYPFPVISENSVDLYLSAENGSIYRQTLPFSGTPDEWWFTEYGNLERSAYYSYPIPSNPLETNRVFLKEHCYAFPVPLTYQNGGVLYFNIMVNQNLPVTVKIFDISGKQIFKEIHDCQAYTNNRNKLALDINGLATGIYFAILEAKSDTVKLRFAVER